MHTYTINSQHVIISIEFPKKIIKNHQSLHFLPYSSPKFISKTNKIFHQHKSRNNKTKSFKKFSPTLFRSVLLSRQKKKISFLLCIYSLFLCQNIPKSFLYFQQKQTTISSSSSTSNPENHKLLCSFFFNFIPSLNFREI